MKLPYLLLLLSCCALLQTILAHGRHLLRTRNSDEDHVKDATTSLINNNGHHRRRRRHLLVPSSHRRSLQNEAPPSDMPSDQPSVDVYPFNTGCDPDWEAKFLEFNRTRHEVWANPICYSYVFAQSCFCPPEYFWPVRIDVYNDTVVHTEYVNDPNATVIHEQLATMNTLFARLETHCFPPSCPDAGATYCSITYDNVTGALQNVYIDQSKMIMDEEIRYSISDFALC